MRVFALVLALVVSACAGPQTSDGPSTEPSAYDYPAAPKARDGPLAARLTSGLDDLARSISSGALDRDALDAVAASGDARLGWLLSDLLRFTSGGGDGDALVDAFERLTGVDPSADPRFRSSAWQSVTDHLIAWDLPAPPGYRQLKSRVFLQVEPAWKPFFEDPDSLIDWRLVSWGGVLIDDRPLGSDEPCPKGCIPALDDPALTVAKDGDWYPDERQVFGVVVAGEAVALPRNIMEVHEMVNITIGGRRLAVPYCTLCGSAQAYFTDSVPGGVREPVMRTSGLLSRSNKVSYDLRTRSVFDTFTGRALSGPLLDAGVVLEQTTVVTSDWSDWKKAHPDTRIVARDGGIGRDYDLDPLGGRDDNGPIFPIGPVDSRLPVQARVVGVIAPDGTPIAFPVDQALSALADGKRVAVGNVEAIADGNGLRARVRDGKELPAHQAFWFAWSQVHPRTIVWTPIG